MFLSPSQVTALSDIPKSVKVVAVTRPPIPQNPYIWIGQAVASDISQPLRSMPVSNDNSSVTIRLPLRPDRTEGVTHEPSPFVSSEHWSSMIPGVLGAEQSTSLMPFPSKSFEGISNLLGYVPSDANGAVGRSYYVQTVNMNYAVYSKVTGTLIAGPYTNNTIWSGFGGYCQAYNRGDPVVLYDQFADRWLISQFAFNSDFGPYYQCLAISSTDNPTGTWTRYAFQMPAVPGYPNGTFNDYTKLSVWADSYFMTVNEFANASTWVGVGIWALNREQILNGVLSPTYVFVDLGATNSNYSSLLPANLDGNTPPPAGSPGYFASVDQASGSNGWPVDALRLWKFHIDWTKPASATFGIAGEPDTVLPVTSYVTVPCTNYVNCIPQPDSAPKVDAVNDRLMFRLVYRNFGDHEALLANHTVASGGVSGIRWYEVRDPGGSPSIYQQGTYAPDSVYRWMGSIAFDHVGNIGVGYSASNASVYPSIRYAGRLVNDPLGELSQGERVIMTGTGSQLSGFARWGDYTSISLDPVDDCNFWYTNQYYSSSSTSRWQTRIASFKFPSCGTGILSGTVTNQQSGIPISGALVTAQRQSSTNALSTVTTNANGHFTVSLYSDIYTVTATAYNYPAVSIGQVVITTGYTTTQNISLLPGLQYTVSGVVNDIVSTSPLSAVVQVSGYPFSPPVTSVMTSSGGHYTMALAADQTYSLTATSSFRAPQTHSTGILSANQQINFALWRNTLLIIVLHQ